MLFMGEEWGAGTPWRYFTDHVEPGLAAAVSEGRRREFAAHGWDAAEVPDPQDPGTYTGSVLDWGELETAPPRAVRLVPRADRAAALVPELTDPRLTEVSVELEESWIVLSRGWVRVVANLGSAPVRLPPGELLLASVGEPAPAASCPARRSPS